MLDIQSRKLLMTSKWIKVTDQLPKEYTYVLCAVKKEEGRSHMPREFAISYWHDANEQLRIACKGEYERENWASCQYPEEYESVLVSWNHGYSEVTHWMFLPEKPDAKD